MEGRGSFYSQRRHETKEIIARIRQKEHSQLLKDRSEGFLLAEDFANQMRRTLKKARTENLVIQKTQLLKEKCKAIPRRASHIPRPLRESQKQEPLKATLDKSGCMGELENSNDINEQEARMDEILRQRWLKGKEERRNSKENRPESIISQNGKIGSQSSSMSKKKNKRKIFLPMLQLMAKEQKSLRNMDQTQTLMRSIVTRMMVIAIERWKNGKFLESLDLLLQIESHFPRQSQQMKYTKAVWLQLIAKVYLQEVKGVGSSKGKVKWQDIRRKSTVKMHKRVKRQKTVVIRTLASRQVFQNKFANTIRKIGLIHQSTFKKELKNTDNQFEMNQSGDRVVCRFEPNIFVSFPQPSQVYHQQCPNNVSNYAILVIRRDPETNLFPYNYPRLLNGFLEKQDYTEHLCAVNSVLVPQTRCLNRSSALFIHLNALVAMLVSAIVLAFFLLVFSFIDKGIIASLTIFLVTLLGAITCSYRISSKYGVFQSNATLIHDKMSKVLHKWAQRHKDSMMDFRTNDMLNVLVITFPFNQEESSQASSMSSLTPSRQALSKYSTKRFKRLSIKLQQLESFTKPTDLILQNDPSSSQEQNDGAELVEIQEDLSEQLSRESFSSDSVKGDNLAQFQSDALKPREDLFGSGRGLLRVYDL